MSAQPVGELGGRAPRLPLPFRDGSGTTPDTVLSLPDEENTLNKIRARLKQDLDLSELPRLSPLQYRSGKVKLIFLDKISTPPGADPPPTETDQLSLF